MNDKASCSNAERKQTNGSEPMRSARRNAGRGRIVITILLATALGPVLLPGLALAQTAPAVTIRPGVYLFGGNGGIPITYGWQFMANSDITIAELGFCDGAPYSEVGLTDPHTVGVFDADGQLVLSAEIPAGSPGVFKDNFFYVPVQPKKLSGGKVYTIGAYLPAPKLDFILYSDIPAGQPPLIEFDPRVAWLQGVSDYPGGPSLAFPASPCCGTLLGFFGPTFTIGPDLAILDVSIDVKPGTSPNTINLRSGGTVPVAILSGAGFDATQVNPASVLLGGAPVKRTGNGKHWACNPESVNHDQSADLVCHVVTSQLTVLPGDSTIVLEGETLAGVRIRGEDSVRIIGN